MRKIGKKKLIVAGIATAVIAAGAGTALAYWTSTGSGTGGGTTASSSAADIQVQQQGTLTAMYPGDSAQNLVVKVHNAGTNSAYVNTVSAASISVTPLPSKTCTTADYTFTQSPQTVQLDIAAGATTSATYTVGTLQFNDKPDTVQDGCQGATVTVTYASN